MKYFYHLLFALFICIFSKEDYKEPETNVPGYESLLKWGKSNNLRINKNIRFIKDKYTKQYSAKESISKGEVILDIPPDCMININKALKLLNSKKYRKAYNSYIEADKINLETFKDKYHAEKAFMSYILYIVNHKKNYFEKNKNKFYEYYKPMEYAFEENLDSLPFFFSSEQMKFFLNTSFGSVFEIINSYINEEVSIFEKKIFQKSMSAEDYLSYRILVTQKSYEVDGVLNIVPFLDYIKKDFKKTNCDFKIEKGHIIITASHKILPSEELIMRPITISNQHRFIFFGETFDEIMEKFESFSIPVIIPYYVTDKRIDFDINSLGPRSKVDLGEIDFYKGMIGIYKKFAKLVNEDDSEIGACNLIIKYLTRMKENYEYVKKEDIRKAFFKQKDIDNVMRIIEGEKNFLERRINILKLYINEIEEKQKRKPDYSAEEVNDL